jgi:hypothetical protein
MNESSLICPHLLNTNYASDTVLSAEVAIVKTTGSLQIFTEFSRKEKHRQETKENII